MAAMMSDLPMPQKLDYNLSFVNTPKLDYRQIATRTRPAYTKRMDMDAFRRVVLAAMRDQGVTKAELSRRSEVSYHALDKFLKGSSATTSVDKASAISNALGIPMQGETSYDELRQLFFALPEEQRGFVLNQLRAMTQTKPGKDRP